MKYALNLAEDGRILSATYEQFATADSVIVDGLPEGNIADYKYISGQYVHDPLPVPEETPSQLDIIEAQVTYTAMMTDTLLEV
jgi:hypothetical protein